MMVTKEQITDWFCERNKIKIEELDKYHRYAVATTFKYAQEQVKNITYKPVLCVVCPKCGCNKMQDDGGACYTCLNVLCDFHGQITL